MDIQEICEQVDMVALHQLVTLDLSTQALRPRLTDEMPVEEAVAITHAIAALNAQMLRWVAVLTGGTVPGEDVCPACREAEEREGGEG